MAHIPRLQQALRLFVMTHGISRLVTTGEHGYDNHPDHIAMHIAAVAAARLVHLSGHGVEVWALNREHRGTFAVWGDRDRKLGAIGCHSTQKVHPDLLHWGGTDTYTPLIAGPETYDALLNEVIDRTHTKALEQAAW